MKNSIFTISSLVIVFTLTIYYKNNNSNSLIYKTKKDIRNMRYEKKKVFNLADSTLDQLEIERRERQTILDSMDLELTKKENIVNSFLNSIEQNKKLNSTLTYKNNNLLDEKNELEKSLIVMREQLLELTETNIQTNEILYKVNEEKSKIYNDYIVMKDRYVENTVVIVDTIYQIDTVCYKKEQIKKLVLKN